MFYQVASLESLRHLKVRVLGVVDVVVSKLVRFNANDRADIGEMVDRDLVPQAEDLPKYVENLHAVERDYLGVPETPLELPDWFPG